MKKIITVFSILIIFVLTFVPVLADNTTSEDMDKIFASYMATMQKNIKKNWIPTITSDKSNRVVVLYKINKSGKLTSYEIVESSGIPEFDKAAIKALKKTSPFEPLPENYKEKEISVRFVFDYNARKNCNHNKNSD